MAEYNGNQDMRYDSQVPAGGLDPMDRLGDMNDPHNLAQGSVMQNSDAHMDLDELQKIFTAMSDNTGQLDPAMAALVAQAEDFNSATSSHPITTELLNQMKMQQFSQLQHLQSQIFQHQMELLRLTHSNQAEGIQPIANNEVPSHPQFPHGLPTPMQSYNLQPQAISAEIPASSLTSPMIPMEQLYHNITSGMTPAPPDSANTSPQTFQSISSAPARLVFPNAAGSVPLPSPASMEYDISPIPSPWLGPMAGSSMTMGLGHDNSANSMTQFPDTRKRSNTVLDLDVSARKRQTSIKSSTSTSKTRSKRGQTRLPASASASLANTPMIGPSTGRTVPSITSTPVILPSGPQSQAHDTPSPVDLSNTSKDGPASFEQQQLGQDMHTDTRADRGMSNASVKSNPSSPYIEPVTPASIMGLVPQSALTPEQPRTTRSRVNATKKATLETNNVYPPSRPTRKATTSVKLSMSPPLKPILPDGVVPSHAASSSSSSIGFLTGPGMMQKKNHSHKAAEQKRRDSLKTSFDDLRLLLPPIPLPSEDAYFNGEDPPLPGSLPPRGPPKGEADGPNRHVSKLQLLRCGNDYIRQLVGRVGRRDEEIQLLRNAVARLRLSAADASCHGLEELDLNKDLDAEERETDRARRSGFSLDSSGIAEEDGDEDE